MSKDLHLSTAKYQCQCRLYLYFESQAPSERSDPPPLADNIGLVGSAVSIESHNTDPLFSCRLMLFYIIYIIM